MHLATQLGGMTVAAALMAAGSLCINASKVDGKMLYLSATVMLLVEGLKGLICGTLVVFAVPRSTILWIGWREALYFAIPALLYTVDNNLVFVILRFIDPATLSILWNLKIFTTAVLFRVVLRRSISHLQVVSLVLLMLGVATTQSKHDIQPILQQHENMTANAAGKPAQEHDASKVLVGLGLVSVACVISSFAGIATEFALKKNPGTPFVLQNIYLAFFSIAFNGVAALTQVGPGGFFFGYNSWTWGVVGIQVAAGLCMGLILKFLDNIACVFTHAMAMLFTTLVSIVFFSFDLSLEFACGLSVCVVSMYLYHIPPPGADPAAPSSCHGGSNPTAEKYHKVAKMSPIASDAVIDSPCDTQDDEDDDDEAVTVEAAA